MITRKGFRPIPGYQCSYCVNRAGDVLSLRRVVKRRDGASQPIRQRVVAPMVQRRSGLRMVVL